MYIFIQCNLTYIVVFGIFHHTRVVLVISLHIHVKLPILIDMTMHGNVHYFKIVQVALSYPNFWK